MRSRAVVLLVLAGGAAVAVACGPHEDVTPAIAVQPGAAARAFALMGRTGANERRKEEHAIDEDAADAGGAEAGRLVFACVESIGAAGALTRVPCVATLEAVVPSDAGDGGDGGAERTEVVAADGKVTIAIAPGRYRVTASREPDDVSARFEIDVRDGGTTWGPNEGAVVLARIVDTHGYLEANAAAHGFGEPDARVLAASWLAREAADVGDALDVWSTGDEDTRARAVADLLARLAANAPVTAIASGDAKTFVRVADESLVARWDARREADFARGVRERRDVVLSNGPFLRVSANTAPIGGVARARGGEVEVSVHVECAAGVNVDRVSILRARGAAVEPQPLALHPFPHAVADTRAGDVTFHLRASKDDAFVVVADGASSFHAMTGALWIDADGDGESLGRKVEEPTDVLHPKDTKGKVAR
jgi:hypothetical protein